MSDIQPNDTQQTTFDQWWHEVGSAMPPKAGEDREDHVRRVAKAAVEAHSCEAEIRKRHYTKEEPT